MKFTTRILVGHVLDKLRELPDKSVHCCVTSPPYWCLRDYGTEPQVWGGNDPACMHKWGDIERTAWANSVPGLANPGKNGSTYRNETKYSGQWCSWCGAWRGSLGMEPAPSLYVEHLVAVFGEVRRVLRDDGTLWLNLGDSYNGNQHTEGLKPKDLTGIPWRVAFALQEDGWYLRRDIIWSKPNVMPESVSDRPTTAHEYLFLLTKKNKYFYDAEAIKPCGFIMRNKRSVWEINNEGFIEAHFATFPTRLIEPCIKAGTSSGGVCSSCLTPFVRQETILERVGHKKRLDERYFKGGVGSHSSNVKITNGWISSCKCGVKTVPAVVLDPFFGAGTTGLVSGILHRNCIGIELKPVYAEMAMKRINNAGGFFYQAEIA